MAQPINRLRGLDPRGHDYVTGSAWLEMEGREPSSREAVEQGPLALHWAEEAWEAARDTVRRHPLVFVCAGLALAAALAGTKALGGRGAPQRP